MGTDDVRDAVLDAARELGDTVLVMDNGTIVHRGAMDALAEDVALQERLLGLSLETHQ